ncbi:MAG TPA: tetratricopeptide repeat protein [Nitrospinota bacterium]|jgi:Tfp pilus assembly protein PilF|nr:tetratricopeptide repeat protein [Nitrospinota bacterium]
MKKLSILFAIFALGFILVSCGEKSKDKKGTDKSTAKSSASQMGLKAPADAANKEAASKNDEGMSHLVQRHWDTAAGFFKEAIEADPNLAEAHFNLALSLHKTGKHGDASKHFKKAKELASGNSKIVDNKILKDHVK